MIPDKLSAGILQNWFATYTFSWQEKRVIKHLSMRHIDLILPVHRKINLWKKRLRMFIENQFVLSDMRLYKLTPSMEFAFSIYLVCISPLGLVASRFRSRTKKPKRYGWECA